jgi:hypothetical protein
LTNYLLIYIYIYFFKKKETMTFKINKIIQKIKKMKVFRYQLMYINNYHLIQKNVIFRTNL